MIRKLTKQEIGLLESKSCSCKDWNLIEVTDDFDADKIRNVHFTGNCVIGSGVTLFNISRLSNYRIGNHVTIENVQVLEVIGVSGFGNGLEVNVLNEGGGREVPIYNELSAQIAYLMTVFRHDPDLVKTLKGMIQEYVKGMSSEMGWIGDRSSIANSNVIRNVWIDKHVVIDGVTCLEEGSIIGEEGSPTLVGQGVVARGFIVQSGSSIDTGALIEHSFIGQGVQIGKQFSMENCLFFANCEGFHSEAVSVFAGPYTVTHHRSTLLIAGMYSFYNAGSGTNQSNHMYKLGPVHQGIVERGSKTGSFSYLLWPSKVGAFSVVMGKHGGNFDTSEFPFSYITVDGDKSFLTPAMNLITVGTKRDTDKWPKRDRRKGKVKLDLITFDLFNPFVMNEVMMGIDTLTHLYEKTPKEQEGLNYKGVRIKRLMLKSCRKYYEMAMQIFIGDQLKDNLGKPDPGKVVSHDWIDLAGLVIPINVLEGILETAKTKNGLKIKELNEMLRAFYQEYKDYEWSWTIQVLKERFGIFVEKMTDDQLNEIMLDWKNSRIRLNNMILADAKKEFDSNSIIGYGLGESGDSRGQDFDMTRGKFESNSFVLSIMKESEMVESEYVRITGNLTKTN